MTIAGKAGGMKNPRTIDELCAYLDASGHTYTRDGNAISADGDLWLNSLPALPEGVSLSVGGSLYLSSLTTLPEGVSLSAGRGLWLGRLTTLPEGVSLSAGRCLYLNSLTDEWQRYQGRSIRLRTIDGMTTRLISRRNLGDATLWSAQYFNGHLDTDPRCYVAQSGEFHAHGGTGAKALRDLRFKIAQVDYDPAELAQTVLRRGTVTFDDYRLLTGACESGLRQGLIERGVDPDIEEMPLAMALALSRNGFGGEQFAALIAGARRRSAL